MRPTRLILVRHGETQWSKLGKHTSHTNLPLTEKGQKQASALQPILEKISLYHPFVMSSPRLRAQQTAQLAHVSLDCCDASLSEWNYGDFEGFTTTEIRKQYPFWTIWNGPIPNGESLSEITNRADNILNQIFDLLLERDVLIFGHGHFSRVLIARWLRQPADFGAQIKMPTCGIAVLGSEHEEPSLDLLIANDPA